jgi:hypothetical protein
LLSANPMQVRRRVSRISIARITGQGLASIAILVTLLWTCIIGERLISRHAARGAEQVMRSMRELRFKTRHEPAAAPVRPSRPPRHSSVG